MCSPANGWSFTTQVRISAPPARAPADAVRRIREAGIEQQILSASERGMLIASLRRLGLEGYFGEIYAQDNFYAEGKLGTAKAIASRFGERARGHAGRHGARF